MLLLLIFIGLLLLLLPILSRSLLFQLEVRDFGLEGLGLRLHNERLVQLLVGNLVLLVKDASCILQLKVGMHLLPVVVYRREVQRKNIFGFA